MLSARERYAGGMWYARSPEKDVYAGRINNHPTGLVFPVGLPIRVLAEGRLISRSTPAFQAEYCWRYGAWDPICSVGAFEYTVHGSAPWYEAGTGLYLTWSRSAGYYDRFYGLYPTAEFFRRPVPSADTLSRRELHFNRMGCCYYIPWGTTAAWETYEGVWRFGAVPDDGGQAELGVSAVAEAARVAYGRAAGGAGEFHGGGDPWRVDCDDALVVPTCGEQRLRRRACGLGGHRGVDFAVRAAVPERAAVRVRRTRGVRGAFDVRVPTGGGGGRGRGSNTWERAGAGGAEPGNT